MVQFYYAWAVSHYDTLVAQAVQPRDHCFKGRCVASGSRLKKIGFPFRGKKERKLGGVFSLINNRLNRFFWTVLKEYSSGTQNWKYFLGFQRVVMIVSCVKCIACRQNFACSEFDRNFSFSVKFHGLWTSLVQTAQ